MVFIVIKQQQYVCKIVRSITDTIIIIARLIFRLDALALSVIATATWLAGWLAGCHTPVLYQNR